ncbi:hypothetical protein BH09PLA1_BH09PLA1_35370 [soil metagenome]
MTMAKKKSNAKKKSVVKKKAIRKSAVEKKPTGQQAARFDSIHVRLEVAINATPARVWSAIVNDSSKWWPRSFYTGPDPKGFIFEPQLGGQVYEDWGNDTGLVWYDVIGVDPERSLLLRGQLTAQYGGPAMTFLEIKLEATGESTTLKLHDNVFGVIGEKTQAAMTEGWKILMEESLKKFVEQAPG